MMDYGTIYLVGAGVGEPEYLTIQAHHLLLRADVVIYDALIEPSLLAILPDRCTRILVGKRGGEASVAQGTINEILISQAQQYKTIVRLKSGDPFLFGRAWEEIEALEQQGIPWQVVPGLSSALAVPALAGIPLTTKDLSQNLAVITGHDLLLHPWAALGQLDTLVILMGTRNVAAIVAQLKPLKGNDCPIAIIHRGGTPHQRLWQGTLTTILDQVAGIKLSPAIIVVGAVAQLYTDGAKGMINKTILVTRAADQASKFTQLLQSQGATVVEMPTLVIQNPSTWEPLDHAIKTLASFDWLILTSANGVNYFFDRLWQLGLDLRAIGHLKIAVVGKKTAEVLREYHLQPDFIPPNFIADDLVTHFPETLTGQKILFPRVESGGRDLLVQELTHQGAEVKDVPAYESTCPPTIEESLWEQLHTGTIDVITFASSKTVVNFVQLLASRSDRVLAQLLDQVLIASIGPQTSGTCHQLLGRVDIEAQEYTLEGLATAIAHHFSVDR